MQAFRAPSHLNYRKKRTPQITQDATGLQAVARHPTNHKVHTSVTLVEFTLMHRFHHCMCCVAKKTLQQQRNS